MESFAHRDGCHRWHTCPSDTGSYICGDLGHGCGGNDEDIDDQEEDTEPADDNPRSGDEENDNGDSDSSGSDTESGSIFRSNNNDNEFIDNDNNPGESPVDSSECQGQADCFTGIVTEIVDGDTLDVNNVRVRLTLVNTPELGDSGYSEAKEFTESMCPVGSEALVDEDDGQKEGSFDRLIGLVYCGNEKLLLNEHLLKEGLAKVFGDFCGVSEFSEASWIQRFGC